MRNAVVTTPVQSAPHLLARALGRDCVGPWGCFYCGAACDGSLTTREYVKADTFTGWPTVARPDSLAVCVGCVLALRDTSEVRMVDGEVRQAARAAMRGYSWIVTATDARAASPAHLASIRAACLAPPDPPYAIIVSESGQTHQIYRAVVGRSTDSATANLEGVAIHYQPRELRRALEWAGKLCAVAGKPRLRDHPLSIVSASALFGRYRDAEAVAEGWARVGPTPLGRLASWLCPKMEDSKHEHPGDFDG